MKKLKKITVDVRLSGNSSLSEEEVKKYIIRRLGRFAEKFEITVEEEKRK